MKKWGLIVSLFATLQAIGQDYAADIRKIIDDFSQLGSYSIKATVSVGGEESYSFEAWTKSSPYGSHIRSGHSEMLVNNRVAVAVDHEDKLIRVQRGDFREKGSRGGEDPNLDMVEEFMSNNTSVEYLGSTDTYKTYVLYQNSGIEKSIIKISKTTGFFHEIEVFYKETEDDAISIPGYTIRYTAFEKNPEWNRADFSESVIVKKQADGSYLPADKYKGYRIEIAT